MADCSTAQCFLQNFPQGFLHEIHESIETLRSVDFGIDVEAMHAQVERVAHLFMDSQQRLQALIDLPGSLNRITNHAKKIPIDVENTKINETIHKWMRVISRDDLTSKVIQYRPSMMMNNPSVSSPFQGKSLLPPIDSQPLSLNEWVTPRSKTGEENCSLVRKDRKTLQGIVCWWSAVTDQLKSALAQPVISPIKNRVLQIQLEASIHCLKNLKTLIGSSAFVADFFSEIHDSIDYLGNLDLGVDIHAMHNCVESFVSLFMSLQPKTETLQKLLKELEKIVGCAGIPLEQTAIQETVETWIQIEDPVHMAMMEMYHPSTTDARPVLPRLNSQPLNLVAWKTPTLMTSDEDSSSMRNDLQSLREVISWWSTVEEQLKLALAQQEISPTKKDVLQIQIDVSKRCFGTSMELLCSVEENQQIVAQCTSASSTAAPRCVDSNYSQGIADIPLEGFSLHEDFSDEEMSAPELFPD